MKLLNKKALVTGSSRGIGKAIALLLAQEGAEVIIHYSTNEAEAEAVKKTIVDSGGKAAILQANLLEPTNALLLAEAALKLCGSIDILINNAGISYKKHFFDQTLEDIDCFTNINFKSTLLLSQKIAHSMVLNNIEGSIYSITSINAIQPGVGQSVYGASKAAVETLMKGVALELAPHNIRVNTFAVGATNTDMVSAITADQEKLALVNAHIPMGRMGEPEEIAAIIVALISSGTYMTGSTIKIDGGWLLNTGFISPKKYG